MKTRLRGLRDIPSVTKLRRTRQGQSQADQVHEAIKELDRLGREKALLCKERENWQEKIDRIDARLREIEQLESPLLATINENMTPGAHDGTSDARQTDGREEREVVVKY